MVDGDSTKPQIAVKEGSELEIGDQAVNMKIGCLIGLFESVDRQVAYIHTQLERIDIQLSYCGFSACNAFQLSASAI